MLFRCVLVIVMCVAAVAAVGAPDSPDAKAAHRQLNRLLQSRVREATFDEFLHHLAVSEEQRAFCDELYVTYRVRIVSMTVDEKKHDVDYWVRKYPVLDAAVDLDALDMTEEERMWVRVSRSNIARGAAPAPPMLSQEDRDELSAWSKARSLQSFSQRVSLHRKDNLEVDTLLSGVLESLAEDQLARWERAVLRLRIDRGDAVITPGRGRPSMRVDLMGVLEEAAADGCELSSVSECIMSMRKPVPNANAATREFANILLPFEFEYAAVMEELWAKVNSLAGRSNALAAKDDIDATRIVRERIARELARTTRMRLEFIEAIAQWLEATSGAGASRAWLSRAWGRIWPDDSTPRQVDTVIAFALEHIEEHDDRLAAVRDIETSHAIAYIPLRRAAVNAGMLAYIETQLTSDEMPHPRAADAERCKTALRSLRDRTELEVRSLLSSQELAQLDAAMATADRSSAPKQFGQER